jgi:hypothetical protein
MKMEFSEEQQQVEIEKTIGMSNDVLIVSFKG